MVITSYPSEVVLAQDIERLTVYLMEIAYAYVGGVVDGSISVIIMVGEDGYMINILE